MPYSVPPQGHPGRRRSFSNIVPPPSLASTSTIGAFASLAALPTRRSSRATFQLGTDGEYFQDESPEDARPTNTNLHDDYEHAHLPPLRLKSKFVLSFDNRSTPPFPSSSPTVSEKPPSPESRPFRPSISRTPSTPILLSNVKPLRSSLKSSSSSPNKTKSHLAPNEYSDPGSIYNDPYLSIGTKTIGISGGNFRQTSYNERGRPIIAYYSYTTNITRPQNDDGNVGESLPRRGQILNDTPLLDDGTEQRFLNQELHPSSPTGPFVFPPELGLSPIPGRSEFVLLKGSLYRGSRFTSHNTMFQSSEIPVPDSIPASLPSQLQLQSDPVTPPSGNSLTRNALIKEHAPFMVGLSGVLGGIALNAVCSDKTKGHPRICYALSTLRIYSLLLNLGAITILTLLLFIPQHGGNTLSFRYLWSLWVGLFVLDSILTFSQIVLFSWPEGVQVGVLVLITAVCVVAGIVFCLEFHTTTRTHTDIEQANC